MLQTLIIKNYALIDEVEIDFASGFSIITGETGAGKSIMLGALGLLLGGRADTKAIADKSRKTIIEATFTGDDEELIIRREISPSGRSRAFVNDSPVTLQELAEKTVKLLDIHSQHANLSLNSREGQLQIIDAMSDTAEILEKYRRLFREYVAVRQQLKKIKEQNDKIRERRDLIEYQLQELNKINPKRGELEEVERRFEMLSDADDIRYHLSESFSRLNGHDESALQQIKDAQEELSLINPDILDEGLEEDERLIMRLKDLYVELKDIAETIENLADSIESNPVELSRTGARMRQLLDAVKHFHVEDGDALVDLKEQLTRELAQLDGNDFETQELEQQGKRLARELKELGEILSEKRKEGGERFATRLMERTIPLGLPNLRFKVKVTPAKLTIDGGDIIEFVCSFNKNGDFLPMATTASGGELSRLTLGIKSLMAEKMEMPTIIFDEIDTGVSGEIADKMGRMMESMADNMQVITITHLPQVAARGKDHFKVYKRDTEDRTISDIKHLTREERIKEIAGMLSGETLTESGIRAAEALLGV